MSRFDYFRKDQEAQALMGFWEAEDGIEVAGKIVGRATKDKVMVVLAGQLYASAPGILEQVAGPGDLVAAVHYRQTRVVAEKRARVLLHHLPHRPRAGRMSHAGRRTLSESSTERRRRRLRRST